MLMVGLRFIKTCMMIDQFSVLSSLMNIYDFIIIFVTKLLKFIFKFNLKFFNGNIIYKSDKYKNLKNIFKF